MDDSQKKRLTLVLEWFFFLWQVLVIAALSRDFVGRDIHYFFYDYDSTAIRLLAWSAYPTFVLGRYVAVGDWLFLPTPVSRWLTALRHYLGARRRYLGALHYLLAAFSVFFICVLLWEFVRYDQFDIYKWLDRNTSNESYVFFLPHLALTIYQLIKTRRFSLGVIDETWSESGRVKNKTNW